MGKVGISCYSQVDVEVLTHSLAQLRRGLVIVWLSSWLSTPGGGASLQPCRDGSLDFPLYICLHLLAWMVVGPWYFLLHLAGLECHYLKVFSLARLPLSWSFGRKSKLLFYFYLHICLFSLVFSGFCLFQLQI